MEILTGCMWHFQDVYTLWNPVGAVIRLEHLIAVGHLLLLRVVCSRSEQRESLNAEPNVARFRGTVRTRSMKAMCSFCALNHSKGQNLIELTRLMRTMLSHCNLENKAVDQPKIRVL